MAGPNDNATFLEDVSEIVQEQYFDVLQDEVPSRLGRKLNRLFRPAQQEITGDGKTLQVEIRRPDTVRFSHNPLGNFASPSKFTATTIKARFNKSNTSANDFSEVSASAQTDDVDIEEAGKGSVVDFVDKIYRDVMPNFENRLAIHRHMGRNALIHLVNGTPTENDSHRMGDATATADNTDGARWQFDGGLSVGALRPGDRCDIYDPTNNVFSAQNVMLTDTNPADDNGNLGPSVGFEFVTSGLDGELSTGDLANVADNDEVYFSGERNAGMYSLGAFFGRPSSGDSFIGGVDRTAANNRYLLPISTRENESSTSVIKKSFFNDLAIAMGYQDEDEQPVVLTTNPEIEQTLRDQIGEDALHMLPTNQTMARRFQHFGSTGLIWQHPTFGPVMFMSDPLHPTNTVRMLRPDTWTAFYYGWRGLRPVREGGAHWYRMQSATPGAGKSKIWKADWYALLMDFCFQPWMNGQILNVSA